MNAAAPNNLLVSTAWLADHLDDPRVRIVDCRNYYAPGMSGHAEYDKGHIPGAVFFDWPAELKTTDNPIAYRLPRGEQVRQVMERLGVGDDTILVGYDDEGGHHVSRVWLVLQVVGHDNVRILEGGITKWRAEGRPISTEPAVPRSATFSVRDVNTSQVVTADQVLAALNDADTVILDVRRWGEHTGEENRAKHGGRIPGSVWALWNDNLDWDGNRTFLDPEAIRARHEALGVTPRQRVITYCQGAVRAVHAALALRMAGYPTVEIYDGSWEEWGSRDDLPDDTGDPNAAPEPR
ncbi:MAG: sulfurtransferase [Chloroflexi bacterium]|nr:sulfurtransferase [Chloroflexota bacterium]